MTALSYFTTALATALVVIAAVHVEGHRRGESKVFSVYKTSDLLQFGTISYDGVEVDTTRGWIDSSVQGFSYNGL